MGTGFQEPLRQCGAAQSGIQKAGHDAEFGGPGGTASQAPGTGKHTGCFAGDRSVRKIVRENPISKLVIFLSGNTKTVRIQLAGIQQKAHKISANPKRRTPEKWITKNAASHKKRLATLVFGTPWGNRTLN